MAMRIGKRATLAEMDADGWQAFGREAGVGLPLVRRRITDLVDSTAEAVARVLEDISNLCIDPAAINHFAGLIAGRAKLVRFDDLAELRSAILKAVFHYHPNPAIR
ncbi:hypothetical protein ILFOPFJJ_07050 [Ensifer psoraleae]|nr:hypothetical protein [Sinorhizobium psoraleae]